MGFVVPAKEEGTWGKDILSFAMSLAGQKLEEKKLALDERAQAASEKNAAASLELGKGQLALGQEELAQKIAQFKEALVLDKAKADLDAKIFESDRELKVAQAAGLKEQATQLGFQNFFLKSIADDPEAMKNYYMQDQLIQALQATRLQIGMMQEQRMAETAALQAQQTKANMEQSAWTNMFGDWAKEMVDTPMYGAFLSASKLYMKNPTPEGFNNLVDLSKSGQEMKQQQQLGMQEQKLNQQAVSELSVTMLKEMAKDSEAFRSKEDLMQFKQILAEGDTPVVEQVQLGWGGALSQMSSPWRPKYRVVGRQKGQDVSGPSGSAGSAEDSYNSIRSTHGP